MGGGYDGILPMLNNDDLSCCVVMTDGWDRLACRPSIRTWSTWPIGIGHWSRIDFAGHRARGYRLAHHPRCRIDGESCKYGEDAEQVRQSIAVDNDVGSIDGKMLYAVRFVLDVWSERRELKKKMDGRRCLDAGRCLPSRRKSEAGQCILIQ